VFHTDLLLMGGVDAEKIAAAAGPGLDAATTWGMDTFHVAEVRLNVSRALTRAGHVTRAAQLLDPVTEDPVTRDRWPAQMGRAGLDVLRGRLEAASGRIEALVALEVPGIGQRIEIAEYAAVADLWASRPRAAYDRLLAVLHESVTTDASVHLGEVLVLAAHAAADLVDSGPESSHARRRFRGELGTLLTQAKTDPFAVHPTIAARPALAAAWTAETTRLAGEPSLERWVTAANAWDMLSRPHDAAYCRWRAAQVALSTGHGTAALRLLRRASADAREHVPLLAAIAETTTHAQPREQQA
jgi:hypothetical protein